MLCPVVPNSYHLFAKGQWLELGCEEGPGLEVVGAEEEASSSADGDWTPMPSLSLPDVGDCGRQSAPCVQGGSGGAG